MYQGEFTRMVLLVAVKVPLCLFQKKKKKKKTLYPIIMSEFRTADCSQSSKVTWAIKTNKSRRGRLQSKLSERGRECIKA
jgi:hypothetical protein